MSMDRSTRITNRQIIEEAAAWFVEINEGEPDPATRERFDEWLRRSPEHARAYLRILPVWEDGAALDTQANGDPRALIAWAREGTNVVPLSMARVDTESAAPPVARRSRLVTIAASVAFLCVAIGAGYLFQHRNLYETAVGEQRLITLSDGSRVELNSRSRLRVTFSDNERGLELLAGQALFRVVKDAKRPFIVRSDDVIVRAVGTQFDVYRKKTGTVVTVVEGRVAVVPAAAKHERARVMNATDASPSSVFLSAGQQTVIAPEKTLQATTANVVAATAWTQQRLEFSRTPLREVTEEFNRYNERQLVVRGEALQDFYVTGTFSSSDPASLVTFLKAQAGVTVQEDSTKEIIISAE